MSYNTKHALHRRSDIFVQSIRKLNDDNGALAWGPQQPPNHRSAGLAPYLAKHNLHTSEVSMTARISKRVLYKNAEAPGLRQEIGPRRFRLRTDLNAETVELSQQTR